LIYTAEVDDTVPGDKCIEVQSERNVRLLKYSCGTR